MAGIGFVSLKQGVVGHLVYWNWVRFAFWSVEIGFVSHFWAVGLVGRAEIGFVSSIRVVGRGKIGFVLRICVRAGGDWLRFVKAAFSI